MLETLWPYMRVALADSVRASVEPMLKESRPGMVHSLAFDTLDFGAVPPTVEGKNSTTPLHVVDSWLTWCYLVWFGLVWVCDRHSSL